MTLRRARTTARRAGFTLIEVMVAITLLGLVVTNLYMVLADSSKAFGSEAAVFDAEMQARRTLDRIAMAVIGSSRDSLFQTPVSPVSTSELSFKSNLGVEDGEPVWSDPQKISMTEEQDAAVTWFENPGAPAERRIVWSKWVRAFADGEISNGVDDNGNGLVDEKGLSFEIEGDMVVIRLTIEKVAPDGTVVTRQLESRVTCRN